VIHEKLEPSECAGIRLFLHQQSKQFTPEKGRVEMGGRGMGLVDFSTYSMLAEEGGMGAMSHV
jgi:hypothetical protein